MPSRGFRRHVRRSGGLCLVLLSMWGCTRRTPAERRSIWDSGHSPQFTVTLKSTTRVAQAPLPLTLQLQGHLAMRVLESGERTRLLAALSEAQIQGVEDGPQRARLISEVESPFIVELRDGRLSAIVVNRGQTAVSIGLRHQLAAALQQPIADVWRVGARWSGEEWDPTGRYAVEYKGVAAGKAERTKVRYLEVTHRTGPFEPSRIEAPVPDSAGSTATIELDDQGLRSIREHDVIALKLGASDGLTEVVDLELVRSPFSSVDMSPSAEKELDSVGVRCGAGVPCDFTGSENLADTAKLDGRTLDSLVEQLSSAPAESGGSTGNVRGRAFIALVTLLRRDPESMSRALVRIRSSNPETKLLVDALGMVGTEAAVRALEGLVWSKDLPRPTRLAAATGIIRTPTALAASAPILDKLLESEEFRAFGILGLGTLDRKAREQGNRELSLKASRRLQGLLDAAASPEEAVRILDGISNSGDELLWPSVKTKLGAASPESVRMAAIRAVRLMGSDETEQALRRSVDSGSLSEIEEAVRALADRKHVAAESVKAVGKVAQASPSAKLRAAAVATLGAWAPFSPEAAGLLRVVAAQDPEPDLRARAEGLSLKNSVGIPSVASSTKVR